MISAVQNDKGLSNTAVLVVSGDGKSHVSVTSVDQANVKYGDTVTIRGNGFVLGSNDIHT